MIENMHQNDHFGDDHIDDHVDENIKKYFSDDNPKNFFMFAGAGSGKTRSLVNALSFLDIEKGAMLSANAKKIAVITYTNAACDEISRRLRYKPVFWVSTIHSFLWELIKSYQADIKSWVIRSTKEEIIEIEEKQRKGRSGKAADKRAEDIRRKNERLAKISTVKYFTYNPNGENVGHDSLNHSEVIKMGSEFIATEGTLQEILIGKYPILLIDESQDTKKDLVDALFTVSEQHKTKFIIGMFGDTMQKIYMDGKDNLANCIPDSWERPEKIMNHRSTARIVRLANTIRSTIDRQKQRPRSDVKEGTVRLFITSSFAPKEEIERRIAKIMAEETGDAEWEDESTYKSLILEHRMAASRFGFSNLFAPQDESGVFDTSLRDGSIPELSLLANIVSPLIKAVQSGNDFEVSKIIRKHSPLFDKKAFTAEDDQTTVLEKVENAVEELMNLWKESIPSGLTALKTVQKTGLFKLGNNVNAILAEPIEGEPVKISALRAALASPFDELERYFAYVTNNTRFATHQGVKGLEFPRVMVIMDDTEARGFLFSYDKLFGTKTPTTNDMQNAQEGNDTSIMRTTRLFYVACTRAQKSLAVVAYTEDIDTVRKTALLNDWFNENEICILGDD